MARPIVTIISINMPDDMLKKRAYAKAREYAFGEVALKWHNKILPKHFEDGAENEYQYAPRATRYLKYKRKLASKTTKYKNKPLQFTGRLKSWVTRTARIVSTPNKTTIYINVPGYVGPRGKQAKIAKEMTQLSKADKRMVTITFGKAFEKYIKEHPVKTIKKV